MHPIEIDRQSIARNFTDLLGTPTTLVCEGGAVRHGDQFSVGDIGDVYFYRECRDGHFVVEVVCRIGKHYAYLHVNDGDCLIHLQEDLDVFLSTCLPKDVRSRVVVDRPKSVLRSILNFSPKVRKKK